MAAREFSADRDTMATPNEFWCKETPMLGAFLANLYTVPLAAIGHGLKSHAGCLLVKDECEMGDGAQPGNTNAYSARF
jgi:hypothetical protein